MFPISSLFSFAYSLIPKFFCSISFSSSFIVSIVLCPLALSPFHLLQFLSNLAQYFLLYLLSNHSNNFLTVNLSGNSPLLNVLSSCSCLQTSSMSCQYSFSNSSTASFVFPKFSIPSQVLDSAVNPFHHTRYLFFPFTYHLFKILSISHSSSPLIMTRAGCFFLCSFTCPIYLCILLILTTKCIFTVLNSSNSTVFGNTIFFIL